VPDADPVEVLEFAIESMGKTQTELATILGSTSRASEILNRRRKLTLDMIRKINTEWKIPIDALTDDYPLKRAYA
jgi:HTH-type transcriptional regulator/antitoxin HigA